eukprot:CAMPEP_0118639060 /NCGR_PEP_ID=MMETSP0785-20121206/4024_1 /TAXON_ID=91992 /ORGANISM="Bolidomonas pacifica, Strain CCMP 1866" /LENGTH=175 /DNA_ID=CAMNT_0006530367 /DNA_START=157 /DNA_END=686 /DNA_ORIENTATION=+
MSALGGFSSDSMAIRDPAKALASSACSASGERRDPDLRIAPHTEGLKGADQTEALLRSWQAVPMWVGVDDGVDEPLAKLYALLGCDDLVGGPAYVECWYVYDVRLQVVLPLDPPKAFVWRWIRDVPVYEDEKVKVSEQVVVLLNEGEHACECRALREGEDPMEGVGGETGVPALR